MVDDDFENTSQFYDWLNSYDSADKTADHLLVRFIEGVRLIGIDVYRSSMWLPTAHPELWGTQVIWSIDQGAQTFRRDHDITSTPTYLNTPGEGVHKSRQAMRWSLNVSPETLPYDLLRDIQSEGGTDYLIVPFHTDHAQEQPWITFSTKQGEGFSDEQLQTLKDLCKPLSWKARVAIAESATDSLLSIYLGPNAAQHVLNGQFRRGTGEVIHAVIWFCDLRGFTQLGDTHSAARVVEILDQYFECVAGPIEDAGGEILKFIGDAVLAVFPLGRDACKTCDAALNAAQQSLVMLSEGSKKESGQNRPPLEIGIALHVGEVLYGNIGGRSRLDFTVIGSAVNEASRIEALCKTTAPLLTTRDFADLLVCDRLESIGTKTLRGVSKPHEVFTLKEFMRNEE